MATFICSQRAEHGVLHAMSCRVLGVSESWFYKWKGGPLTVREQRHVELNVTVQAALRTSQGMYGWLRVTVELWEADWKVSKNTVAESMARQGLVAQPKKCRQSLTCADNAARHAPDLLQRGFFTLAPNLKWCGDLIEIPTGEGPLYLAAVEDLFSRRMLEYARSEHHDAELTVASLRMAAAVRGGSIRGVIFHTDRGGEYTAELFQAACRSLGVRQLMSRVACALDNAAAESFFSTIEHQLLSRPEFSTAEKSRREVAGWIDRCNRVRRHSSTRMRSPIDYRLAARRIAETV